jgi:surfeit locus 1 family protein
MRRSTIAFLGFAIVAAAICIRLGFWQLDRREQRRARNAVIAERMKSAPVDASSLTDDTTARFRRVRVTGRPDFEHEFLLTLRGNRGSPGADIITPFRIPGSDTAILVNRGWIYSPDGMTADLVRWREPDTTFMGYVASFEAGQPGDSIRNQGIRRLGYEAAARAVPYPIKRFYVVAVNETTLVNGTTGVVRLEPPKLDEGPHMSYAFQWFAFAGIALIGGGIVAARTMQG